MKERFNDILELEDVNGVLFINFDGRIVFNKFVSRQPKNLDAVNWLLFIHTLDGLQETEFIFENIRCYIRRTGTGYIFVVMGAAPPIEMVRLNCDILLPVFEPQKKKGKGLGRFFKFS